MDPLLLKGFECLSSSYNLVLWFPVHGLGDFSSGCSWRSKVLFSARALVAWLVVLVCCLWKATQYLIKPFWTGYVVTFLSVVSPAQHKKSSGFDINSNQFSLRQGQGMIQVEKGTPKCTSIIFWFNNMISCVPHVYIYDLISEINQFVICFLIFQCSCGMAPYWASGIYISEGDFLKNK